MFESQRIYDRRTALLAYIQEGRAAFTRLLLQYAKRNGAYVATDVETRWGLDFQRKPRIYLKAATTSTSDAKHNVFTFDSQGARIQVNDIFALMGSYVPVNRNVSTLPNSVPSKTKSAATPLPELVRVIAVNKVDANTYTVTVERNFGGTGLPAAGHSSLAVSPSATTFFLKMGNSLPENSNDQDIYYDTVDWDYNYCQYVMRKWGSGELDENVSRFFSGNETPLQRNGRKALQEFFDELDIIALFGVRKKEMVNGKYLGYAGGLLEFIPQSNYVGIDDTVFQTKNFNELMKDKFFYGSQTKVALCGANVYTKISNMLDNKIILPSVQTGWGLELTEFRVSNGGKLLMTVSDTMSLNGMSDYMILYDPATFRYGHLQNLDIKVIDDVETNPHEKRKEIYGYITFQRVNPEANYVFVLE